MALTPQQIAVLAGEDPLAYYRSDLERLAQAQAGAIPAESITSRGATTIPRTTNQETLGESVSRVGNRALEGAKRRRDALVTSTQNLVPGLQRAGFTSRGIGGTGAVLGGVGIAAQQFSQDQPVGAIAAIPGSMIGGGLASAGINAFTKGMPGIGGTILRAAAPMVGSLFGGGVAAAGAEGAKNFITGEQIGKKPETARTDAPKYAGNIPLNESARMLDLARAMGEQELSLSNKQNASDIGFSQQINQYAIQNQIQLMKAQMPFVTKLKNDDLVRSQALLNTQGNVDARLGLLATQGALARGGQAEAGAFARTAISTNPYANAATRQSPNIQFG